MGLKSWWKGPQYERRPGPFHEIAADRMRVMGPVLIQDWSFILSYLTREQQDVIHGECSDQGIDPLELFRREPWLFKFQREETP